MIFFSPRSQVHVCNANVFFMKCILIPPLRCGFPLPSQLLVCPRHSFFLSLLSDWTVGSGWAKLCWKSSLYRKRALPGPPKTNAIGMESFRSQLSKKRPTRATGSYLLLKSNYHWHRLLIGLEAAAATAAAACHGHPLRGATKSCAENGTWERRLN